MDDTILVERIRARAYELWQQDGGLEGCADDRTANSFSTSVRPCASADGTCTGLEISPNLIVLC
ncbi:DUF2934 domain-containing protein [Paraburkholderia domus]|uniref:DUF2934 domain-containing protein n=1 Tax=Paraburkholderia domus TaxID=2793075 RepID=UPI001B8BA7FD